MRYTAVFEWPDGGAPGVKRGDGWLGGELCAVQFDDALGKECKWAEGAGCEWRTGCGLLYEFYAGGPADDSFDYCPYCGARLILGDRERG